MLSSKSGDPGTRWNLRILWIVGEAIQPDVRLDGLTFKRGLRSLGGLWTLGLTLAVVVWPLRSPHAFGQDAAREAKQAKGKWVPLFQRHAGGYVIRVGQNAKDEGAVGSRSRCYAGGNLCAAAMMAHSTFGFKREDPSRR